jgi:hypothetical protein
MASIRILVDPTRPHGALLVEAVDNLYDASHKIDRIAGMMEMSVRTDTPPLVDADFYPLCEELGVPTANVEEIKTLFYLVASVKAKLADVVLLEFVKQCDQG